MLGYLRNFTYAWLRYSHSEQEAVSKLANVVRYTELSEYQGSACSQATARFTHGLISVGVI